MANRCRIPVLSRCGGLGSVDHGHGRGRSLLLIVCIALLSVELSGTQGAKGARRKTAPSGQSILKDNRLRQRGNQIIECCLPPNTAVSSTVTSGPVYTGIDGVLDYSSTDVESTFLVWDGKNAITTLSQLKNTVLLSVADPESPKKCPYFPDGSDCYMPALYYLPKDETCYVGNVGSSIFQYPEEISCLLTMRNAKVISTDKSGIVTVSAERPLSKFTAQFKLVKNGCIPVSDITEPKTERGYRPNTTSVTYYRNETYKTEPFKKSYRALLSLTADEIKPCPEDRSSAWNRN